MQQASGRFFLYLAAIILLWPSVSLFAGECSHPGPFYETNGYVVTKVTVQAPIDIGSFVRQLAQANNLPLRARSPQPGGDSGTFIYQDFLASASQLDTVALANDRYALSVVIPLMNNCDDEAKTLEVVYRVYHVGIPVDAIGRTASFQSPPIKLISKNLSTAFLVQPSAGYDAARHLFGGGEMALHSTKKGPLNDFYVAGYGSSSSMLLQAQLSGSQSWRTGPVSRLGWGMSYVDIDLPSGAYTVHEKHLSARLAAVGRPNDKLGLVLHFGAAFEGGNQHSLGPALLPSTGVLSSPVGSLKLYLGSSWTHHATSLTGSYGLELGSAQSAAQLDFTKHIVNTSFSTRFLPANHHPLGLDTALRAGWLVADGTIPLSERFFGGNVPSPFIVGDPWEIQSNPILRSFPSKSFAASNGPYGGDSFVSVNTTLAYAIWAKPLMPKEVAQDAMPAIQFQLKGATTLLAETYMADTQAYKDVEAALSSHAPTLDRLHERLVAVQNIPDVPDALSSAADDALDTLDDVQSEMKKLGRREASADPTEPARTLLTKLLDGEPSYLVQLITNLAPVVTGLNAPSQESLHTDIANILLELQELNTSATAQFQAIDPAPFTAKAEETMQYPRHVISDLMNVMNLYSISPAVLFDVARLGPQPAQGGMGMRYGVGPAIRFGLVNINFTAGYSFNVQRQPGEPRGAAVVGLTFENLF